MTYRDEPFDAKAFWDEIDRELAKELSKQDFLLNHYWPKASKRDEEMDVVQQKEVLNFDRPRKPMPVAVNLTPEENDSLWCCGSRYKIRTK